MIRWVSDSCKHFFNNKRKNKSKTLQNNFDCKVINIIMIR